MIVAALVFALQSAQGTPTLAKVLQRAGDYVAEFYRRFSGIVAEERYTQHWETAWDRPKRVIDHGTRTLLSDLALVRVDGWDEWLQFRDVFDVDGMPVRDRAERLTRIFIEPASVAHQVAEIRNESARYNLGDINRNVNTPLLVLRFLLPKEQRRAKFRRARDREVSMTKLAPDTDGVFRVSTEVWAIDFDETEQPTVIRTNEGKSLRSSGRFWIDPATGRVLLTELRSGDRNVRATIDVSFKSEPLLDMLVPVEMREEYWDPAFSHITGIARYGRFRQFQVNVTETFGLIKR